MKNKFTKILLLLMLSTFFTNSLKTYAISSYPVYSDDASHISRPLPEAKPEYYNGFPSKIFIGNESEAWPEKIVADVIFPNGGYINDEEFIRKVRQTSSIGFAKEFISTSGLVVNDITKLPVRYVQAGEVAFSIVLSGFTREFFRPSTFSSLSYWKHVKDDTIGPNDSTTMVETTHYGMTNKDAFSIAKATGTSITTGVNFGIAGGGLSMGAKFESTTSESLTNTYGREISLDSSHDSQIRHLFNNSTEYRRRVAIYQYCEVFKATVVPTDNYRKVFESPLREFGWKLASPRLKEVEIKTNSYAAIEIGEPILMTELTQATLMEPELKDIIRVDEMFGGITKPSTSTEIIEANQTTRNYVVYDFDKNTFIMNGPITLDLKINIQRPGRFSFTVYNHKNETGYIIDSTRILDKGENTVTLTISNLSDIKNIYMFRN